MAKTAEQKDRPSESISVQFTSADVLSPELADQTDLLNEAIEGFAVVSSWVKQHAKTISSHPSETAIAITDQSEMYGDVIDAIHLAMWAIIDDAPLEIGSIRGAAFRLTEFETNTRPSTTQSVPVLNKQIAKVEAKHIAAACHDLHSRAGLFGMTQQYYSRKGPEFTIPYMKENFAFVRRMLKNLQSELTNIYPKEQRSIFDILFSAKALFLNHLQDLDINDINAHYRDWHNYPATVI